MHLRFSLSSAGCYLNWWLGLCEVANINPCKRVCDVKINIYDERASGEVKRYDWNHDDGIK